MICLVLCAWASDGAIIAGGEGTGLKSGECTFKWYSFDLSFQALLLHWAGCMLTIKAQLNQFVVQKIFPLTNSGTNYVFGIGYWIGCNSYGLCIYRY